MGKPSPPSRGAWIEIFSVDRVLQNTSSPPSRGAWIEMPLNLLISSNDAVAPLAGGVD